MKKSVNNFFVAIFFAALITSCGSDKSTKEKSGEDTLKKDTVKTVEKPEMVYNKDNEAAARYISGISQEEGSAIAQWDTLQVWKEFKESFDSSWVKLEQDRFSKMKEFKKTELVEAGKTNRNLFYPFSGPDILNGFTFFPEADTFTLIALEPWGKLPDFKNSSEYKIKHYLASVDQSLNDLFKKSYFITKNMITDLHKEQVNGTVPLICIFLKRTGNTIGDIKEIAVDDSGKIVAKDDSLHKKNTKGVQVNFVTAEGKNKTLFYFKTDLSDDGLKVNKGLNTYLNSMSTCHTYLKSASYLLHYRTFNMIRAIILDKSDLVLQDDSGIAYKFFDQKKWNVQLYGKYAKPVKDFSGVDQPDLKKAYEDPSVKAMPFTLGYHWGTKDVNLQLATRKVQ